MSPVVGDAQDFLPRQPQGTAVVPIPAHPAPVCAKAAPAYANIHKHYSS